MYAADELHAAIYGALNGSITGAVVDDVPPGTPYPYTVIGEVSEAPDDLYGSQGSDVSATLHVWSDALGGKEVDTIMAEIDAALHRANLTVAGARCWEARRTFSGTLRDEDPDTGRPLRHGIVRYRFRLE